MIPVGSFRRSKGGGRGRRLQQKPSSSAREADRVKRPEVPDRPVGRRPCPSTQCALHQPCWSPAPEPRGGGPRFSGFHVARARDQQEPCRPQCRGDRRPPRPHPRCLAGRAVLGGIPRTWRGSGRACLVQTGRRAAGAKRQGGRNSLGVGRRPRGTRPLRTWSRRSRWKGKRGGDR